MRRKSFNNIFLLFLVIIFCMSTGYAYLNSSLYINGTSIISANVWDVGLDNLNVTAGSVVAIKEPTLDNATTTSFEVILENKEDFYEFSVDVVNRGDHDAKLGSLVETTGLTTEQEQYFEHTVTYQNNEPIQVNQLVKKDEFVRLKSKVEYKENVEITQVPESAKTLKLNINMNYDLDDGYGVIVDNNGKENIKPVANGSLDVIGTIVTIGTEQFYVIGTEGDNVKLLSMMNITLDENPIQSLDAPPTIFSNNSIYYTNSIAEIYVNNYKKVISGFGVEVKEARLIEFDELYNDNIFNCSGNDCTNNPYPWIYSTSHWYLGVANIVNYVHTDGKTYNGNFDDQTLVSGVRPVIVISKNQIIQPEISVIEFTINNEIYHAVDGMTWNQWIVSIYFPDEWEDYTNGGFFVPDIGYCDLYYSNNDILFSEKIINNGIYYLVANND